MKSDQSVKYPFQIARPLYTAAIDIVYSQEMMEEFMSPAMNVYWFILDTIQPLQRLLMNNPEYQLDNCDM